jgi:hypothetical protein
MNVRRPLRGESKLGTVGTIKKKKKTKKKKRRRKRKRIWE